MEFMFQSTVAFYVLLLVKGEIPTEDFLFGTTNSNVIWYQHGTTNWTQNNQHPSTTGTNFTHNFLGVHGTAYFHSRHFLVFSDTGAKSIFISNTNPAQHAFVYVGTSASVGHLAVDWQSGNVYWCDGAFGWIGMLALPKTYAEASLNNTFKVVIDKYVDTPSGIAVQPSHQWIFWTDIGKQPKIERAALGGSNRNVLVLHGLLKPVSLTIDTKENNIYWTDPTRRTIESCDFYGNNRKVIRTDVNSKYYGIEIFRDFVFVSEQLKKQILVFSVTDGQKKSDPYTPGGLDVGSIALYTAENQYLNNDACTTRGCGHICLITNSDAVCTCQDGYKLHSDGKQCTAETKVLERSLVFANQSKICALPITYINIYTYLPTNPDCGVGGSTTGTITHLDISVASDEMYFSIGATIYRQKLYQQATSLYTATNQITGLTFDWITTELYWTISQSNTVYMASIPSNKNDQITSPSSAVTSLSKPSYISINPLESVLFAITGESTKKIERVFLNNSTNIILEYTRLTSPKWLTYNRPKDRLYWTDIGKVGSMTSSGQDLNIKDIPGVSTLHGIAVYKDYVLWLQSSTDKTLMHVDETSSENTQHTVPLDNFLSPGAFVIYDKNIQPQRNVPCVKDNGGCQQICVVHGYFPKCECHLGYKLTADNQTCIPDTIDTEYFLTVDQLSNRFYKVLNSTKIGAIDTGVITPVSIAFDYNKNVIVWIDERGNSIKSINKDGNAETTLTTDVTTLTSLDIDQSTSNIYYTTQDSIKVFSAGDSTKRTLVSSLVQPNHIKLHSKLGKMVWIEQNNGQPTIREAFMDGSNIGVVVPYSVDEIKSPSYLAIDTEDNQVIWSDSELDSIKTVSLINTADSKSLLSNTGEHPITVDVVGEYVYYIGNGQRSVKSIRKEDGTNSQVVFSSILFGRLTSLLKVSSTRISRHLLCKDKNGHCSRLCLPRGNNQRACQCRDGVQIKDDGKTCVGDIQCPEAHGAALIHDQCSRNPEVSCDYLCSNGYLKSSSVKTVTCLPNGEWNVSSNILCTRILCPEKLTSGQVSSGCTRYVGSTCGVSCDEGYSGDISTVICHDNGQWNIDVSDICKLDSVVVPTDKSADTLHTGAIIGLTAGGVVIVVILIAVIVVCQLKRIHERKKDMREGIQMTEIPYPNGPQNSYLTAQRGESVDEIYDVIADDEKYMENMKVAKALSESNSSQRYSKWPQDDPPPDYHHVVGADGGYNSYLKMEGPQKHNNYNPYLSPCSDSEDQADNNGYLVAIGGGNKMEYSHHI